MEGIWMKTSFVLAVSAVYLHFNRDPFQPESLLNKNVLVTGASSGIGEQVAYHYARMGANVFITARREQLLKKVVANCTQIGRADAVFGFIAADMSQYEENSIAVIQAAVKAMGGLDHIILNHAVLPEFDKALWEGHEHDLNLLHFTMEVNFLSYVHLTTAALPYLKQSSQGRIGVISSIAGKVESMGGGPYCASKFALDGFFSSLRIELAVAQMAISVTLCPLGSIATERGQKTVNNMIETFDLNKQKFYQYVPVATAEDTALGIIKAVTRGDREFYFPLMFGIENDGKVFPILRHLAPWLFPFDHSMFK